MKKLTLTLVLALLTFAFVNAQVEIKAGVKAGLNISNFTNLNNFTNGDGDSNSLTSFHIGASVSFKFTDLYTLHPEVLYSQQGSNLSVFQNLGQDALFVNNTQELKLKVNYLSFVVNSKFYIGGGNFNLQVAPVIDILLDHEYITNPEGFDFAIMGGVGYDFPFGMTVDVRYKQGITDLFGRNVNNGSGFETTSFEDLVLNQVFQLSLGYQFDF
jgi:opacity protein-like surface antigen